MVLRTNLRIGSAMTALVLVFAAGFRAGAATEDPTRAEARQGRQITIMEGIIDKVLVDSPNLRVSGRNDAHGVYLDSFGAVFTFEASLIDDPLGLVDLSFLRDGSLQFLTGENGEPIVNFNPGNAADSNAADSLAIRAKMKKMQKVDSLAAKQAEAYSKMVRARKIGPGAREKKDPAQVLKDAKTELVQTLLDYGETMTTLRDEQSIAIAGFLNRSILDNKISRVVIQARMKDLREFNAGRISEQEMRKRIVEQES